MKHYILIAVDYQYGFKEGGALGVEGATNAIEAASKLLNYRVMKAEKSTDELSYRDDDKVIRIISAWKADKKESDCNFEQFN